MPARIHDTPYAVADLVPHAAPMLLLDDVLDFGELFCVASVTIRPDSLFFQPGKGVPAYVGIEYMAQTIAAWSGIRMRLQGKSPTVGFLLGTRKFQALQLFYAPGTVLTVRAEQTYNVDGMGVFSCTLYAGDHLCASAQVNVFEPGNVSEVLAQTVGNV
ncbi:MAG TPA: hotdog family protein [Pseudomonadales bacterium]|nr:hotdog family protein [Pseudomonadales bacterium]